MDDMCTAESPHPSIKVVVVGDDNVGKSCLVTRFVNEEFDPFQPVTVGSYCLTKIVEESGVVSKLQVWDTVGQERYYTLIDNYCLQARGIVILFDLTNLKSFMNVKNFWIKKGAADCCKVLVGCKSDLVDSRQVTDEQIKELTDSEGLKYFETSAKLGVNVNESFMFVCKNIIAK